MPALRAGTPGCEGVVHFNNAGSGLLVEWCLRLSPHYYNTEDEVDQVVGAVGELAGQ